MSPEKLERFAAGEQFAVDPDAVERELASLWRAAGHSEGEVTPVTRACLLNVLVALEERDGLEGFGSAERLQSLIDELPRHVAARALIIRSQPNRDGQGQLQSWISANCIIADGGGKLVCSEEVTIAAPGASDHHVPGLARALLVPGLPTSVVVAGIPHGALAEPLLALADRVITEVDRSHHQHPLSSLGRITRTGRHSAMDLGWVGTAALRAEMAGAFDPPFESSRLLRVHRIQCATPPETQWSSRLLMGWLAQSLGAEDPIAVGEGQSKLQRSDGDPLELQLSLDAASAGPSFSFHTEAWSRPVRIRCEDRYIEVDGEHVPSMRRPRQELDGPAALARSLVNHSEDAAFSRALEIAEYLQ